MLPTSCVIQGVFYLAYISPISCLVLSSSRWTTSESASSASPRSCRGRPRGRHQGPLR